MQHGVSTAMLIAFLVFMYAKGWPFIQKTIESAQEAARKTAEEARANALELTKEFLKALERRDDMQLKRDVEFVARLDQIVISLRVRAAK